MVGRFRCGEVHNCQDQRSAASAIPAAGSPTAGAGPASPTDGKRALPPRTGVPSDLVLPEGSRRSPHQRLDG
ncbi:hypothetical protein IWX75_001363 [Arthrobacter sp. CAN_A6]